MENNMKTFDIDGIKITVPVNLFKEAVRVYVLEEGSTEEEKYGNYIHIKQVIVAGFRETLDDLGKITFESVKNNHTEREISERVQEVIRGEIKINGGNYEITVD